MINLLIALWLTVSVHKGQEAKGSFHWKSFICNSNLIEILFCSCVNSIKMITTKFCTWHDSCAVMTCAEICSDLWTSDQIKTQQIFHWICIANEMGPSSLEIVLKGIYYHDALFVSSAPSQLNPLEPSGPCVAEQSEFICLGLKASFSSWQKYQ